jgi:ribose 5-phosphate isomerase A
LRIADSRPSWFEQIAVAGGNPQFEIRNPGGSMTNAEKALEYISDGAVVGLGTGRAATEFIHQLGARVRGGLKVRGVPTSVVSAKLAEELGIPLTTLDQVESLDVAVDGADEVDPNLDLLKGFGGALVREKVVAASAKRFVVVVGSDKLFPTLGQRGSLPVEIVPFGLPLCTRRLTALGIPPKLRSAGDRPYVTDNGNHILDCAVGAIEDPQGLDAQIHSIPGVVGTGLFIRMADVVLVQEGDSVKILERRSR